MYSDPMVTISFLNPIDQPTGRRRLLAELKEGLEDPGFTTLQITVAFAKSGPLLRLQSLIAAQRARGLRVEAIFGIDQFGTSAQALQFALLHFDQVFITRESGRTFHPKIYAFVGPAAARVFVGSNNLTVGGTETNFEAALRVDFALPADQAIFQPFTDAWNEMLPANCLAGRQLTAVLLDELIQNGTVPDESVMQPRAPGAPGAAPPPRPPRSGFPVVPPSALPPKKVPQAVKAPKAAAAAAVAPVPIVAPAAPAVNLNVAQRFVIQIKPHDNGEIHLSVTAALQNPAFFKWPFNGKTVPKKGAKNKAYPQLSPDPVVNITVYGAPAAPIQTLSGYHLNTVYYELKSEIRITASPLVGIAPVYSVMIMEQSNMPGTDYEITIHTPASSGYAAWVAACNQQMPSGGAVPRKFGWF
ncbi:phospholipase D family protein [Mesorhizobium sp. M0984]|uniref:phospholipase D family protein n=1 Tax=Mesorhizobium sp. M0984 TaxID=2957041 RepID=UPI003337A69B